ncbi:alpha/beta hydrolase [Shewanella phage S0112]|nr:alpha/beta hydrolase [Shewanella phage S0112]
MRHVFLVHGFNVKDRGAGTVGKLVPYLSQPIDDIPIHIQVHAYPWFGLFQVMFKNRDVAEELVKKQDLIPWNCASSYHAIGHSNGCAIIFEAAKLGAKFDSVVLINPALKMDTPIPANIKKVYVIHTAYDDATLSARVLDRLPVIRWLIPNFWGAMGTFGYKGKCDSRIANFDMSMYLQGHSDFFTPRNLERFAGIPLATLLFKDSGPLWRFSTNEGACDFSTED